MRAFNRTTYAAALKGSVATIVMGAAFAAAAAQAQEAAGELSAEEIIVTGSRIQRPDLVSGSPVSVISMEDMRLNGTTNVEEYLRTIPQAVASIGGNTNNGNPGVATIDLRNLGEERTLVMVDGKRFVPYDSDGLVDLGMIPTSLIQRVEIVTGGASAVYGSDAIAGVVNFIMNDHFEGLELDTQYGLTERGDANTVDVSITLGGNFADDRGNLVLNFGYTDYKALTQGARSFSEFSLAASDFGPGGSSTAAPGVIRGIPAGPWGPAGNYEFAPNGDLIPFQSPFNFNPFNLLQAPQEKWTATALGHYDITPDVELFGRFSFANNRVTTIIAPTGTFNFPFEINLDNPFLNAQARTVLGSLDADDDGSVVVPFGRRLTELGTRDSIYENTAYQLVGGLRGDFGSSYHWETFLQYGRTDRTQTFANDVAFDRAQQAVLVTLDGNGNPVCTDGSGNCAPANLFGEGKLSEAAAAFIRLDLQEIDTTSQFVGGGFLSGDLPFTLPSATAPGAFVAGAEYRRERSDARPDDNLVQGNSIGFGSSTPISAKYDLTEGYGELKIPLVQDMTGIKSLSLETGIRYSSYESTINGTKAKEFNNTTYKLGGEWTPMDDIRFRAMFQRAVRAPNISEIGQPKTPSTGDAEFDPCDSDTLDVNDAAAVALCVATGVPLANIQGGTVGGPISGQINNFIGGNSELGPEKSNTYTFGAVFTPQAVSGLTVTVDYFKITVKNAILGLPEASILEGCYTIEKDANGQFCSLIARNPLDGSLIGGTETGVDARVRNIGALKAEGIDLAVNYHFDLANGNLGMMDLAFNGTRQLTSNRQDASAFPITHCVGLVGSTCLDPDPKWRSIQSATWSYDDLILQLRWQFLGKVTKDSVAFGADLASDFANPVISAHHYFDLTGNYEINEHLVVRAGINNLTDKTPPVVGNDFGGTAQNSGNTFPATYDPLGRSYFMGVTAKF